MSKKKNIKEINLYYVPTEFQKRIHNDTARFITVACGRRFGKTLSSVGDMLLRVSKAQINNKPIKMGWVSPSYEQSKIGLAHFKSVAREFIDEGLVKVINTAPFNVSFFDGSSITFVTSSNANKLRGNAFDHLVVDEGAYIEDEVLTEVLLPTLMDKSGSLTALSTPKGKHGWFYEYFKKGMNEYDNFSCYRATSYENPYLKKEDIELITSNMTELSIRQEINAEFIAADSQVFYDLDQCYNDIACTCDSRKVMGVDVARKRDDTCMIALCPICKKVVDLEILIRTPWKEQYGKILAFYKRNNCNKLGLDGTGIGDVVLAELSTMNVNVESFIFSTPKKFKYYQDLIYKIQSGEIKWDNKKFGKISEQLLDLEREEKKTTVSYNAATGCKDDVCDALAIVVQLINLYREPFIFGLNV